MEGVGCSEAWQAKAVLRCTGERVNPGRTGSIRVELARAFLETAIATAFLVVSLATYLLGRPGWSLVALLAALFVLSPFTLLLFLLAGRAALYFTKLH